MDTKIEFAKKSLVKVKSETIQKDPFLYFIILWVGLNALYDNNAGGEKDKIVSFFQENERVMKSVVLYNHKELVEIAEYLNSTPQHFVLNNVLRSRRSFINNENNPNLAKDFAEFLYQIRNNMFHAGKGWDEKTEAELLKRINPILKKVLEQLIVAL